MIIFSFESLIARTRAKIRQIYYLKKIVRLRRPAPRNVRKGLKSFSISAGYDRGTPVDRVLIAKFLQEGLSYLGWSAANTNKYSILEIGDLKYSESFFPKCLHTVLIPPQDLFPLERFFSKTLYMDLNESLLVTEQKFDLIIATQVLNFVRKPEVALQNLVNLLEDNGKILITVAASHPISIYDETRWGDYIRFMPQGFRELILNVRGCSLESVSSLGNVSLVVARHLGLCAEEMNQKLFNIHDVEHPLILGAILSKVSFK